MITDELERQVAMGEIYDYVVVEDVDEYIIGIKLKPDVAFDLITIKKEEIS